MNISFNTPLPYRISMLMVCAVFLFTQCKKEDESPEAQLARLPAITQTGARTFGCLVNGHAFTPGGSMYSGPKLTAFYTYTDGYQFNVSASRNNDEGVPTVTIGTNYLDIEEGKTYQLRSRDRGNAVGFYRISLMDYYTKVGGGEFYILKLDKVKRIVSGTFWFDAFNDKNEKVEIREGRFDMPF